MSKNVSIAEAKAHLSVCIRQVEQGDPILITRHGKPVAALVPAAAMEHLERLRKAGPQAGLASLAGGWEGAEELVRPMAHSTRMPPREVASLE